MSFNVELQKQKKAEKIRKDTGEKQMRNDLYYTTFFYKRDRIRILARNLNEI